jgi:hypothetical protein
VNREIKVHFSQDGRPRCGLHWARELSADREQVTCGICANLLNGTHGTQVNRPSGYLWLDVRPCGTRAAYRRHLRRTGKPVTCEKCLAAEARKGDDAQAARAA